MAVEDQEKMAFFTPLGAYCYTAMTFGLRNAGATYKSDGTFMYTSTTSWSSRLGKMT